MTIFSAPFLVGLVGMVLLQTNTMPQTWKILKGETDSNQLSLQMFLQTWLGLCFYQYNAIMTDNLLYIISNSVGLLSVGSIIYIILKRRGLKANWGETLDEIRQRAKTEGYKHFWLNDKRYKTKEKEVFTGKTLQILKKMKGA